MRCLFTNTAMSSLTSKRKKRLVQYLLKLTLWVRGAIASPKQQAEESILRPRELDFSEQHMRMSKRLLNGTEGVHIRDHIIK
jgi:hypothetical protein